VRTPKQILLKRNNNLQLNFCGPKKICSLALARCRHQKAREARNAIRHQDVLGWLALGGGIQHLINDYIRLFSLLK